jgi:hypothetical protein
MKDKKHISKEDEELKQIAEDLWAGRIYSNRNMNDIKLIDSVFMPLMFLDRRKLKQLQHLKVDFFYEYIDKAGPRSINGMPVFTSVRCLTKPETARMFEFYEAIKKAVGGVKLDETNAIKTEG